MCGEINDQFVNFHGNTLSAEVFGSKIHKRMGDMTASKRSKVI
jgi:hypothetical protein